MFSAPPQKKKKLNGHSDTSVEQNTNSDVYVCFIRKRLIRQGKVKYISMVLICIKTTNQF